MLVLFEYSNFISQFDYSIGQFCNTSSSEFLASLSGSATCKIQKDDRLENRKIVNILVRVC